MRPGRGGRADAGTDQRLTLGAPSPSGPRAQVSVVTRWHWGSTRWGPPWGSAVGGCWSLQPWLGREGPRGPYPPFLPFGVHSHTAAVAEAPLLTMAPPSPKMALWVLSRAGGPPLGVQGRECPPLTGPHGP